MRLRSAIALLAAFPLLTVGVALTSGGAPAATPVRPPAVVAGPAAGLDGPGLQPPRAAPARKRAPQSSRRPNIIMIMADDMRMDDVRFAPAISRLIGEAGVTFENSFSPYPLCCPARASFLTGLDAHNHRVFSHLAPYGFGAFDDSYTLATALQRGGYNTGFVGKYLNNYGESPSLVTGKPSWNYVPAGWTDWEAAVEPGPESPATGSTYAYFNTSFNVNGRIENNHVGRYQTNVLGAKTLRLISKYAASSRPFFIYLSSVAPHHGSPVDEADDPGDVRRPDGTYTSFDTPARPEWVKGRFDHQVTRSPGLPADGSSTEADMRDKPRYLRTLPSLSDAERRALVGVTRQRAEAVYVLDRQVAKIIARLKRTGEYGETIVMFTSDNGYFLGEHRVRQGKVKPHEPSLRVPFLVAGPGIPRGETRYDPITTTDLTATIADFGHVSRRLGAHHPADGASKVGTIVDGDQGWTIPVVTEAMLRDPFRRVKNAALGFDDARDSIGIRTSRYKYVRYATGETELYDLNRDPNEMRSVHRDPGYRSVKHAMHRLWLTYKDCGMGTCTRRMPGALATDPERTRDNTRIQDRGVLARNGLGY